MDVFNLVVRFRLAGRTEFETQGASRIRVDGGGLMVFDCQNSARRIDAGELRAFSIQRVNRPCPIPVLVH